MLRNLFAVLALGFQPGLAQAQPPGQAYKVAFWYDSDQPVTSLKFQVYDLAKGQYDEKAVDRWFRGITDHDRKHGAYIRDISTVGQPGATEADRLASAIVVEKKRWAELQRQPLKPVPRLVGASMGRTGSSGSTRLPNKLTAFDGLAPGAAGGMSNQPGSPFPYPYRSGPR